jgi:hypothetical protein
MRNKVLEAIFNSSFAECSAWICLPSIFFRLDLNAKKIGDKLESFPLLDLLEIGGIYRSIFCQYLRADANDCLQLKVEINGCLLNF